MPPSEQQAQLQGKGSALVSLQADSSTPLRDVVQATGRAGVVGGGAA